jgi:hypothetical protein
MATEAHNLEFERLAALEKYQLLFSDHLSNPAVAQLGEKYKYFNELFRGFDLYTTRFNSHTYMQNTRFKENLGFRGSLYSTMLPFPANAPTDKYVFMVDMNNTTNKIMGFGFIKNKLAAVQKMRMYDDPSFNNCIYKSNFYIPIGDIDNPKWMEFIETEFERVMFYGKSNLKRGSSFTRFPIKKLKYYHLKFMLTMFVIKNPNKFLQNVNIGIDDGLPDGLPDGLHDAKGC